MQRISEIALPDARPTAAAPGTCKTCHGSGIVYVVERYTAGPYHWGEWEVQKPCPDCSDVCTTCLGHGVISYDVRKDDPRFGKLYPCPRCEGGKDMARAIHRAALRTAALPETYKWMTFETWDGLPDDLHQGKRLARAAAGLFVDAADGGYYVSLAEVYRAAGRRDTNAPDLLRNSLVLQGPVGVGKTGLVAAIVNWLVARDVPLLYTRMADLISEIQGRYGKQDYPTAEDVLRETQRAPLLVLDEFNVPQPSADKSRIAEDLIRYRHNHGLPTLVTCNITRAEVEGQWGLQTDTALKAMSHWIPMGGPPLRNEGFDLEVW